MGLNSLAAGSMLPIGVDRPVEAALVRAAPVWLTDWTTRYHPLQRATNRRFDRRRGHDLA
jgi:hypothetical protein